MTPDERAEITKLIGVYADETRSQIQLLAEGMDARFENVDSRLDKVDARLDKVDAGLDRVDSRLDKVDGHLDGVDSRLDRLEHEMHREFAEVRAMIKFSYADLDRRLTTLEAGHEEVTDRLSRLEAKLAS
jgi:chromosome segregation ATPase